MRTKCKTIFYITFVVANVSLAQAPFDALEQGTNTYALSSDVNMSGALILTATTSPSGYNKIAGDYGVYLQDLPAAASVNFITTNGDLTFDCDVYYKTISSASNKAYGTIIAQSGNLVFKNLVDVSGLENRVYFMGSGVLGNSSIEINSSGGIKSEIMLQNAANIIWGDIADTVKGIQFYGNSAITLKNSSSLSDVYLRATSNGASGSIYMDGNSLNVARFTFNNSSGAILNIDYGSDSAISQVLQSGGISITTASDYNKLHIFNYELGLDKFLLGSNYSENESIMKLIEFSDFGEKGVDYTIGVFSSGSNFEYRPILVPEAATMSVIFGFAACVVAVSMRRRG